MRSPREILDKRLHRPAGGLIDVRSLLLHFALITYALPKARLAPHIPTDRFEIPEFDIGGQRLALMSAVPFLDLDFRFPHLAPFLKFRFGQTNFRVYVIDRATGEQVVWFFGTTLGSPLVHAARTLWRIPWHYARYEIDCQWDEPTRRYTRYGYTVRSPWCDADMRLTDTGEPLALLDGFTSLDELRLILTHPTVGYFYRTDGQLGSYSVWHEEIPLTVGRAETLYFSLYERLGLLSREEMQRPHSVLLCPAIEFEVYLPPRRVR